MRSTNPSWLVFPKQPIRNPFRRDISPDNPQPLLFNKRAGQQCYAGLGANNHTMISGSKIQEAVELLREAGNPVRIILYGSYGRGTPHEDSDLDFLVVMPIVRNRRMEMVRFRRVLSPLRIPVNLLVVSDKVFREWSDTPGNIFYEAAREGRVLYEAA